MIASIGAIGVFSFMLDTIKWDYEYKNKNGEDHHIVPWNSKYKINDQISLEISRKELEKVGIQPQTDIRNIVHISARTHNRTKNATYNGYIAKKFDKDSSKRMGYIQFNLMTLKGIFKLFDNAVNILK